MKSTSHERIIIWSTLAALAAFSVFCIFWTPYDQLKLLRPVPANAVLVSSHHNLGARLESLATNNFLKTVFDSNGAALKNLRSNRYAARILASRSIMAYVPDFTQSTTRGAWSSSPAMAITAWVGGWTPVLRWALWIHPPEDIALLGDYNGHQLWTFKIPISFFGTLNYFSFAINEGIFIGCLSQDRYGITNLLRIYDGQGASILNVPAGNVGRLPTSLREVLRAGNIAGRPQGRFAEKVPAVDQIWMRFNLPYSSQKQAIFATGSFDALENDYLAATIRFEPDIFQQDGLRQNRDFAEIGKMYACLPAMVALLPSAMVADILKGSLPPAWAKSVKPILSPSSGANNVCLLMVLTGDYGGKFGKEPFRIGVPTVLLAVSGARPEQTKAAVLELLDLINLKHRLGLILNSTLPPAGQCPVFAIESTSAGVLNSLPPEDQGAFAFYHDWFLLASNSAGLKKLLISFQSQAVPANDVSNNWLKQSDSRTKKAFIWIDPAAGGKALRFALMASIIMLDPDGRDPSKQNTIKILKAVRSGLEAISSLKNCAAWLESEDGKTVVRLEIGRKKSGGENLKRD